MKKTESLSIQSLDTYLHSGDTFSYGRADGTLLAPGELNKSSRVMVRRAGEIWNALSLPFSSPTETASAISHNNGNAFAEVNGVYGRQFVMARDLLNNEKICETPVGEIGLLTGICLFSADSASAITENGERLSITNPTVEIDSAVSELQIDKHLSLYEIESVLRLSSFMNAIAKKSEKVTSVHLNVPRVEYYAYILDAFEKGHIRKDLAEAWFGEVDKRHDILLSMLKKRILKNVPADRDIPVFDHSPLDVMRGYIQGCVKQNTAPMLADALMLLKASSPLWESILAVEQPETWHDVNNLGYVFAQLSVGEKPDTITLVVDNPIESKIYAHAKRIAAKLPKNKDYTVLGIYPHEPVIPIHGNTGKTMYHIQSDPAQRSQDIRHIVSLARNGLK